MTDSRVAANRVILSILVKKAIDLSKGHKLKVHFRLFREKTGCRLVTCKILPWRAYCHFRNIRAIASPEAVTHD